MEPGLFLEWVQEQQRQGIRPDIKFVRERAQELGRCTQHEWNLAAGYLSAIGLKPSEDVNDTIKLAALLHSVREEKEPHDGI